MNNRGNSRRVGLPSQHEGYLSWQHPETGEWMVLAPTGAPMGESASHEQPTRTPSGPAETVKRYKNWQTPLGNGNAVA